MKIYICPECGSGKIAHRELSNEADCQSCSWKGKQTELVFVDLPTVSPSSTALSVALEVARVYMIRLAENVAKPLGLSMIESGLVGGKDSAVLTRLIRATVVGAHRATMDEIDQMQKEESNRGRQ